MQFILAYISGIFNVQKSITVLLTSIYEENFKKAYTNEKSRDTIVFSIITALSPLGKRRKFHEKNINARHWRHHRLQTR